MANTVKQRTMADLELRIDSVTEEYAGIAKANSMPAGRTFLSVDNTTVRSEFSRPDFEYYRPSNTLPKTIREEIDFCMRAYDKVALVRNVIDLMSDFGVQGIKFIHTNKSTERFINTWFKSVDGFNVSERFLNLLYRAANVPIYRQEGKIPLNHVAKWKAKASLDNKFEDVKTGKRIIPVKYTILNPLTIEVGSGAFSTFSGEYNYLLKLPELLKINTNSIVPFSMEKAIAQLPPEIQAAYKKQDSYIPLDKDKFSCYFYKKDDWLVWARPMLSSLISSLIILEKMHLADMSALDGAISSVRLWKLGIIDSSNLANSIIPKKAAINKVRNILQNGVGGGQLDFVWGPDIDFKESATQVHNFLGDGKYKQVMTEIYGGLGIPASLTGSSGGSSGGFTNNFISMKTLVDRLSYGREILTDFWMTEMKRVQAAIGFVGMPVLSFAHMSMTDESTYLNLLMNLADRNIISDEAMRENVKLNEDIERSRLKRETKDRTAKTLPDKASPFHNDATHDNDMKKHIMQSGGVAPSEMGIELKAKTDGDEPIAKRVHDAAPKSTPIAKVSGKRPEGGRPKSSTDKIKRKTRKAKPRASAFVNHFVWAYNTQNIINETLLPGLTHIFGKSNLRQLSISDKDNYERLKFRVLRQIVPFVNVDQTLVHTCLAKTQDDNNDMVYLFKELCTKFTGINGRAPNTDEIRQIQASAYALFYEEMEENGDN